MAEFRVRWVIDLEAENPKEAALEARRLQLKHDAQVGHFVVVHRDDQEVTVVDLDEDTVITSDDL